MKRWESLKRVVVLWLSFIGLIMQTAVYAYIWIEYYYPLVNRFNLGLRFHRNGHLLMFGIYLVLLFFFTNTYGGLKVGYLKPMDVFFSQLFSVIIVNVITYFQISLMRNWLVPVNYFVLATLCQLLISGIWTALCNGVYRRVFPPRRMLLIHGDRDIEDILHKFASRKDKYRIEKCMDIREDEQAIIREVENGYGAVVLWDIPTADRNRLLKYCYSRSIRVYMMPKIPDVLVKGSDQLHLFDTPILLTREYALNVEQRLAKRLIDIVCAVLLLVIASPFMLITAILIKCYDGGPVFYKQIRCTRDAREFKILKFRSMRVLGFLLRTIFIAHLGDTLNGINDLYTSILSVLSMAELGVGTALNYSLYGPVARGDVEKIKSYMLLYKKAYRVIGLVIALLGLAISPFLPYLVKQPEGVSVRDLTLYYFIFLFNTVSSYFVYCRNENR